MFTNILRIKMSAISKKLLLKDNQLRKIIAKRKLSLKVESEGELRANKLHNIVDDSVQNMNDFNNNSCFCIKF